MELMESIENDNEFSVESFKVFIENIIKNQDMDIILPTIKLIKKCIKSEINVIKNHQYRFLFIKFLNKIIKFELVLENDDLEVYDFLNKSVEEKIENIKFEKDCLFELKKDLDMCEKEESYDDILEIFEVLVLIFNMHSNISKELIEDCKTYIYALKGINYMAPKLINDEINNSKKNIEGYMKKLKR